MLDGLVADAGFLVGVAPAAMKSAVRSVQDGTRSSPAAIYAAALPVLQHDVGANAAILESVRRPPPTA